MTVIIAVCACFAGLASQAAAAPWDPGAADYAGCKGKTLYVSRLGDNSDGSTWQQAFHTIQAALLAVPDDQGGHQIIIRPDTYVEANLYVRHKGAAGAYNLITGDFDGKLGSGATGWVVVDCSAPGVAVRTDPDPKKSGNWKIVKSDAPQSGFKSVDWWGNFTGPPGAFSNFNYDRWIFRHIYGTGGEGAFGLYTVGEECKAPCTMMVEDCVGIGRFAGAALAGGVGRKDEPLLFRRCYFINLDRWGNAGGVYVRAHHDSMPDYPDVVFEDCTIVSPDNAIKSACSGVDEFYTRVKFKKCRLIVLNFAQTQFGSDQASSGIIRCSSKDGKQLHVDLEDCRLMGYKLFGARSGEVSYTTKGTNKVYLQFQQTVPRDFERIGAWPVELISRIGIPDVGGANPQASAKPAWNPLPFDPTAPNYAGRKGRTIYVSKLGNNSDGSSWQKAFHTIQAALSAVPDDKGGHTVVIRPDTYPEAALLPAHPGASGAYNTIVGDADGSLGSGAKGWVVIDCGDPQLGFKSCDYWCLVGQDWIPKRQVLERAYRAILRDKNLSDAQRKGVEETLATIRKYPHKSLTCEALDRWIYRNVYAAAGNCMFWFDQWTTWDEKIQKAQPFSTVVENCVGIGQAVGGGGGSYFSRRDEPVMYRGCYFMNTDWPGDAGAAYIRAHGTSMPDHPDAIFEGCTLISPDNALQTFSRGCDTTYTRVKLKDCRLIVLNFSQACDQILDRSGWNASPPSTGIIRCEALDAKQLHVDFENCNLMGYKVFGTRSGEVSYATKGKVQAYVEYEQPVPKGIERLGLWPVEVFNGIGPPQQPLVAPKNK